MNETLTNEELFEIETLGLFTWTECEYLIMGSSTIEAHNLTLAQALEAIKEGYTPIPF